MTILMHPQTKYHELGWKFFFALLMTLQCIALGVMWRTYDAVETATRRGVMNEYKIDHQIFPVLRQIEREVANQSTKNQTK